MEREEKRDRDAGRDGEMGRKTEKDSGTTCPPRTRTELRTR